MELLFNPYPIQVTASSSDGNYPIDNVLDYYPGRVWRSSNLAYANITVTLPYSQSGFTVCGFNAIIQPSNNFTNMALAFYNTNTLIETVSLLKYGTDKFWYHYDILKPVVNKVVIQDISQLGILRIGTTVECSNPELDLQISFIDPSVVNETNNGGRYYKKKTPLIRAAGTVQATRNPNILSDVQQAYKTYGNYDIPLRIASFDPDVSDTTSLFSEGLQPIELLLFGHFESPPVDRAQYAVGKNIEQFSFVEAG